MKKLATILLLATLVCTSAMAAPYKVKEKSGKAPKWLNSLEQGYLITEATAPTIEEAQKICLMNIKQMIAESVATQIIASNIYERSETSINDEYESESTFETRIKSKTANLPHIKEVSLSKAEGFYWELRYYKSSKSYVYSYSIRYPFSDFDMRKIVMEYEEHENDLNIRLDEYTENLLDIKNLEDIDRKLDDIRTLQKEFEKGDPRYTKCDNLANQCLALAKRVGIHAVQTQKGEITFDITLDGNIINSYQKPIITASWESPKIRYEIRRGTHVINYDDYACYPDDDNYIQIKVKAGNKYITEKVFINL